MLLGASFLSSFFLSNFFLKSCPVKTTPGLDVRFQTSVNVFPMVFQLPPLFVEAKTPSPTPPHLLLNFITDTSWAASLRTDFPLRINEGLAATPYFALRIQKKCGWLLTHDKAIKNRNDNRVVKESHEGDVANIVVTEKTLAKSKNNKEREAEHEGCGSVFLRFMTKPFVIKGLKCLQELRDVLKRVLRSGILCGPNLYCMSRFLSPKTYQRSCCDLQLLHLSYAMCPQGGDNAFQKWTRKHFVYKAYK